MNSTSTTNASDWSNLPGLNIKSDRNAQKNEVFCAFAINANSGKLIERVIFTPTPDQTNQYNWPKYFSDHINTHAQFIRAGETEGNGQFNTIHSGYRNLLWHRHNKITTHCFTTAAHLSNWKESLTLNAANDMPPYSRVVVSTILSAHNIAYETLEFIIEPEYTSQYSWSLELCKYLNKNSLFVKAGEKNTLTNVITPLGSSYRNKLWVADGSRMKI